MIALIDFDDSFTRNIQSELYRFNLEVEVISWRNFGKFIEELDYYEGLVLGPGPGVVTEYESVRRPFLKAVELKIPTLGICLGHQLLWHFLGAEILRWPSPIHGRTIDCSPPVWLREESKAFSTKVQLYNSWGVDPNFEVSTKEELWVENNLVLGGRGESYISYQFHPESVGTTFPELFFSRFAKLLYNSQNERKIPPRRDL